MLDANKIEQLVSAVTEALPSGMATIPTDIKKNIRAVVSATFVKLDLVTREEFDVQTQLLKRTRAKLDALEQRMTVLEAGNKQQDT